MESEVPSSPAPVNPAQPAALDYAPLGSPSSCDDRFERQMVGIFRYFLYLAVLVPCAAGAIAVLVLMLWRR